MIRRKKTTDYSKRIGNTISNENTLKFYASLRIEAEFILFFKSLGKIWFATNSLPHIPMEYFHGYNVASPYFLITPTYNGEKF